MYGLGKYIAVFPIKLTQESTYKNLNPDVYYGIKSILSTLTQGRNEANFVWLVWDELLSYLKYPLPLWPKKFIQLMQKTSHNGSCPDFPLAPVQFFWIRTSAKADFSIIIFRSKQKFPSKSLKFNSYFWWWWFHSNLSSYTIIHRQIYLRKQWVTQTSCIWSYLCAMIKPFYILFLVSLL